MTDGQQEQSNTNVVKPEVAIATAEKPQRTVAVQTPGYRLETTADTTLSPVEQKQWEAAFYAGTLLKSRLRAEGIGTSQPKPTEYKPVERVFAEEILPIIAVMQQTSIETSSPDEIQGQINTLRSMVDAKVLAQAETEVLKIDDPKKKAELHELLGIWIHDIKGRATSSKGSYQLLQRLQERIQRGEVDASDPETETKITRYRGLISNGLVNMHDVLVSGLPFGEPEIEAFPHEPVPVSSLLADIAATVGETGYLNLYTRPDILAKLPRGAQVDWNSDLAKRFIWNVVTNAEKAYQQVPPTPFSGRYLDVDMQVVDGMIQVTFDDWGQGYPQEMIDRWRDPSQRATAPTGWAKEDIATSGLGLREHTAILEDHYSGSVELYKNRFGGARTVMRIPLVNSHT